MALMRNRRLKPSFASLTPSAKVSAPCWTNPLFRSMESSERRFAASSVISNRPLRCRRPLMHAQRPTRYHTERKRYRAGITFAARDWYFEQSEIQ